MGKTQPVAVDEKVTKHWANRERHQHAKKAVCSLTAGRLSRGFQIPHLFFLHSFSTFVNLQILAHLEAEPGFFISNLCWVCEVKK
jgi:hypothetical protein